MWGTSTALLDPGMTDLSSNQWREYDAGMGGYSAIDPILMLPPDLTLSSRDRFGAPNYPFTYAGGSPSMGSDPNGRDIVWIELCVDFLEFGGALSGTPYQEPPQMCIATYEDFPDPEHPEPPTVAKRCNCICDNGTFYDAKDLATCQRYCGPTNGGRCT